MHSRVGAQRSQPMFPEPTANLRDQCFDADPAANFILAPDASLIDCNTAARALLFASDMQIDSAGRLCLPARKTRGAARAAPVPFEAAVHLRQLASERWLVLTTRLLDQKADAMHVRARIVDFAEPADPDEVANEFDLTEAERPVLRGIVQAICPKQISRELGLSVHTIRSHLRSIYAKMGVHSAAEAQRYALQIFYLVRLGE